MVDNHDLVILEKTYQSLNQGAMLTSNKDSKKKKHIVAMYRNYSKDFADLSMDEYFYKHFKKEVLDKNGDQTETIKHRVCL